MENIQAETPVAAPTTPAAPVSSAQSAAPAPGTPEFAAWAWENRNG